MNEKAAKGDTLKDFHGGQFDVWVSNSLKRGDELLSKETAANLIRQAYKRGSIDATIQLASMFSHRVNEELAADKDVAIQLMWTPK